MPNQNNLYDRTNNLYSGAGTLTTTGKKSVKEIYSKYGLDKYQTDNSGYEYWQNQLDSGAVSQNDLEKTIKASAKEVLGFDVKPAQETKYKNSSGQLVDGLYEENSINDFIDATYISQFERVPTALEKAILREGLQTGKVAENEAKGVVTDRNLKNGEISLSALNTIKDTYEIGTGSSIPLDKLNFYKGALIKGDLSISDLRGAIGTAEGGNFDDVAVRQQLSDRLLEERTGIPAGEKPFSYTPKGIDPFTYKPITDISTKQFKPFSFETELNTPSPVGDFEFDPSGIKTNYDPNKEFVFNEDDPSYKFRQEQAQIALERSASARGNLLSGGQIKGAERYASDLASQEYGNAFNRFNATQQQSSNAYNTEYQQAMNNQLAGYRSEQQNYQNDINAQQQEYQNQLTSYGTNASNNQLLRQQEQIDYNRQLGQYNVDIGQEQQRYNRVIGEYGMQLNQINQLAGYGASAVGAQQNAGSSYGSATGNSLQNQGNMAAQAALTAGQATAQSYQGMAQSINQGVGNYLTASLLKPLKSTKGV